MSFPTEFPHNAYTAVAVAFKTQQYDPNVLSLAAYDLIGYGLYCYFGEVNYPVGAGPDVQKFVSDVLATFTPEDFKELAKNFPEYLKVATRAMEMHGAGIPVWLIVIRLAIEFGPKVIPLIKKIIALIEKMRGE